MEIRFYLKKKEALIPEREKHKVKNLKEEINLLSEKLKGLGYDADTVSEIRHILLRPHGHPVILTETENNQRIPLGRMIGESKPTFALSFDYETNLPSMKKWVEKQSHMNIIRVEKGTKEQVVSFEDFAKEMQEYPWTSFGMPKKYNAKEETVWENLR